MALTSIGSQKTPGRPIEITFGAELGTPSDSQELLLIGHLSATGGTATAYELEAIANAADEAAGLKEAELLFGVGAELAKMVAAAIRANAGGSTFPKIKCMPLANADAGFGAADVALTNIQNTKAEFIVSPYASSNSSMLSKLKAHAALVSGAQRVENAQYGSFGVVAEMTTAPGSLPSPDSEFIIGVYLRDSSPAITVAELASALAAVLASGVVPFNPLDDKTIGGLDAPEALSDYITVGAGLESETILDKGFTPLYVKPNGEVAIVRAVTSRLTVDADGVTDVTAYYDVMDFQVLYFWRKTLKTRFSQPDMKRRKASDQSATLIKSEMIRLAKLFEEQNMFQAVDKLAKQFRVERNASDRHRFDYKTPVNVIPGLHVIAGNIEAGTQFDTISI